MPHELEIIRDHDANRETVKHRVRTKDLIHISEIEWAWLNGRACPFVTIYDGPIRQQPIVEEQ